MAEVIQIEHTDDCVPTSKYRYAKWDFNRFNPLQTKLLEIYKGDSNIAIAAATSAGKTVCAEMYMAYEVRKRKGKAIYVGPLKALAKEKEDDWKNEEHHFSDLNTSIVTGDFRLTPKRMEELNNSDVIVMTPEMLASRCRNDTSDKSNFLKEVGTVVFDESHLLTVPGRGDHIEVALMKLVQINPDVRIVLLSATMPNVDEICEWVTQLTQRDTYYLESDYRPCPLNIHYEAYWDGERTYEANELQKVATACGIIEYYNEDKFLVFVHTKRTGRMMLEHLKRYGVEAEFHNADLKLKERLELEKNFKSKSGLRVIVATSTLAWGLNLPARRVIVTGVHRGLDPVENYDIWQMAGRAGRPRFDPVGDAYVLVPENEKKTWIRRLKKNTEIKSTLLDYVGNEDNPHYKTLAFHVVSEIHYGNIKTKDGFKNWFRDSLAHHQDVGFDDSVIDRTIQLLLQYKAIRVEDEEYKCTPVGIIASMFYYSPFDVSDLRRNFHFVFDKNMADNDMAVAMAMGNTDTNRWGVVSKAEREQMFSFEVKIKKMFGDGTFTNSAIKHGYAYYNMLKGKRNNPSFAALQGALTVDLDRTMQVIQSIDTMSSRWGKKDWFKTLRLRLVYGVGPELVQLCQIPNIGQARAQRLFKKNIRTPDDFLSCDATTLAGIMKCGKKLVDQALEAARLIQLKNSLH